MNTATPPLQLVAATQDILVAGGDFFKGSPKYEFLCKLQLAINWKKKKKRASANKIRPMACKWAASGSLRSPA